MIKILIADNHYIYREGLKSILSHEKDITVVGTVNDLKELLLRKSENSIDVMVIDFSLTFNEGMKPLRKLKTEGIPVLVLGDQNGESAIRSYQSGASGYVTRDVLPKVLVEAIRKISKGCMYISQKFAEQLIFNLRTNNKNQQHDQLTDREYEVMHLIASGKSISVIAADLEISVNTVSTHRANILKKMNMKNNAEITHYALSNGLVQ